MKETRITVPEGYEVEKIEPIEGAIIVTYKEEERKLPKSWDGFCKMFPVPFAFRPKCNPLDDRRITTQVNIPSVMADFTENPELSDALVALIKLILLRNAYNGDWVPDWKDESDKFIIGLYNGHIETWSSAATARVLYFKTEELRDEFLRNFRPLIEKLKPLYGIKEGGEEC